MNLYDIEQVTFKTIDNKFSGVFNLRHETNDFNTINSAFHHDEYGLQNFNFQQDDIFVDVGAHIGGVSILAAKSNSGLKVLAFEALKENYDLLVENIKGNGLENRIVPYNLAVSKYNDRVTKVYLGTYETENGRHHRYIGSEVGKGDFEEVNTISLNTIMKDISRCRYLKVDCEGAEYAIFDGASKETLEKVDYVFGEFHGIPPGNKFEDVDKFDKKIRYTVGLEGVFRLTKGVFLDATPDEERKKLPGHFIFINENSS